MEGVRERKERNTESINDVLQTKFLTGLNLLMPLLFLASIRVYASVGKMEITRKTVLKKSISKKFFTRKNRKFLVYSGQINLTRFCIFFGKLMEKTSIFL